MARVSLINFTIYCLSTKFLSTQGFLSKYNASKSEGMKKNERKKHHDCTSLQYKCTLSICSKKAFTPFFSGGFFFFHISILLHFTFSLQKLRRVTHHRTQAIKQTPSGDAYNLLDMLDYLISIDNSIITTTY